MASSGLTQEQIQLQIQLKAKAVLEALTPKFPDWMSETHTWAVLVPLCIFTGLGILGIFLGLFSLIRMKFWEKDGIYPYFFCLYVNCVYLFIIIIPTFHISRQVFVTDTTKKDPALEDPALEKFYETRNSCYLYHSLVLLSSGIILWKFPNLSKVKSLIILLCLLVFSWLFCLPRMLRHKVIELDLIITKVSYNGIEEWADNDAYDKGYETILAIIIFFIPAVIMAITSFGIQKSDSEKMDKSCGKALMILQLITCVLYLPILILLVCTDLGGLLLDTSVKHGLGAFVSTLNILAMALPSFIFIAFWPQFRAMAFCKALDRITPTIG
ncbi:DgyrCDS10698 [Dimorphilus gyrociliatus]|uniref:DgyrCDS10698 n=1 Tax=Dimorphilus gyrociliatus TaxID=2664684 RepID=A0A7I8W0Z7_9ANNE|nr:DgyrCDS10698 [Dimorphilus gyrociliatus]